MAASIPASLKSADISRFALRAQQLESAKPIVAYYCKYQIVNQILAKGLHNADEEAVAYTTHLMDQLEQFKSDNSTNDAVTDDVAGKAYVEQFGLETFQRADNAVRANKASRQTADTFQAAATFLELLHIWGNVDPNITSKIKYSKFHALRIAKALKAGEDPNLSNPTPEPEPTEGEVLPALDPNDPDVQMLNGGADRLRQPSVTEVPDEAHRLQRDLAQKSTLDESLHPSRAPSIPRPVDQAPGQPSVVDVPDEAHRLQRNMARQSTLDESLHPSRAPSIPRPVERAPGQPSVVDVPDEAHRLQTNMARQSTINESLHPSRAPSIPPATASRDVSPPAPNDPASYYANNASGEPDVSPVTSDPPNNDRNHYAGGNYFPQFPSPFAQPPPASTDIPSAPIDTAEPLDLPSAPSEPYLPSAPSSLAKAGAFPPTQGRQSPSTHSPTSPSSLAQVGPFPPPQRRQSPIVPAKHHGHFLPDADPIPPAFVPQSAPRQPVPQAPPQLRQQPAAPPQESLTNLVADEEAIMKAQKHARWAISALNFEDVPTAVRELRGALEALGSR